MGCFESRVNTEEALNLAEAKLGFADHSVDVIYTTIRKYSHKSKVNQAQLERISNQLSLTLFPVTFYTQSFLNALRKPDDTFALKDLLVLGVFLGEGDVKEKAKYMYEIFDDFLEDSIERTRISGEVLKTLSKISIEILPHLIRGDKEYLLKLFENQANTVKSIISRFPEHLATVTQEDWVKHMCFIEKGNLLSTRGWREYTKSMLNPYS